MENVNRQAASDNRQMTIEEWARIQARALVQAGQQAADSEGGAARAVILLVDQIDQAGQQMPEYGRGWLELLKDFVTRRLKDAE